MTDAERRAIAPNPPMRKLIPYAMLLAFAGCGNDEEPSPDAGAGDAGPPPDAAPADAGVDAGDHDAGPPRPPARLFARRFVSKIRERPDRESFRIGYLRAGAIMQATTAEPVRTDDPRCRGGWYELTTGGFVCNGRAVIAFWGRRPPEVRGAQPQRDDPLPYRYARNRREGNPMYRNLPTDEQAAEFEGFRIPGQEPPPAAEGEAGAEGQGAPATAGNESEAAPREGASAPTEGPTEASTSAATPSEPAAEGEDAAEGEEEEEEVTLASLAGDPDSILLRRMTHGMIVSLDRDFRAGDYRRRYWRTIHNGFVPYRTLAGINPPEFMGARLDETTTLPIGFILSRTENVYLRTDDGRARRGGRLDFHHRLDIVDEVTIGTTDYFIGADGRLYRQEDVREIAPAERPDEVGPNEKWIEVNLSEQYLIAYEGDRPVWATLISSGRAYHPDDPDADFLTPTGTFRIRAKHLAANMDGDTAADGPYSIEDVPWVMYFQLAYALHGAFWHRAFGFPRSHGCVNLAPRDAQFIFNWSDPQVPSGWHGAYPTEDHPGTLIWIHGETPGQRAR